MKNVGFKRSRMILGGIIWSVLFLPVSLAMGLQVGGPGGGSSGGAGGTGGGTGSGDGHYVYTETYESNGNVIYDVTEYSSNMSTTKTIVTGTFVMTLMVKVLEEADKLILDPPEYVDVEFTATLDSAIVSPTTISYGFNQDGFTLESSTNTSNTYSAVGQSFSGTAKLKYNGANSTGKHYFILDVGHITLGGGHIKVVWCSQETPQPITQIDTPCNGGCGFLSTLLPTSDT